MVVVSLLLLFDISLLYRLLHTTTFSVSRSFDTKPLLLVELSEFSSEFSDIDSSDDGVGATVAGRTISARGVDDDWKQDRGRATFNIRS